MVASIVSDVAEAKWLWSDQD